MRFLSIMIVDDHPIVRSGLTQLLDQKEEMGMNVVGLAENAKEALACLEKTKPNFAIIDISLKGLSGLELIRKIRDVNDSILILTLSMHDEKLYAERSLKAGANGYLMKQEDPEKIIEAIISIKNDGIYLSPKIKNSILKNLIKGFNPNEKSKIDLLSDRELEVLKKIGNGKSTNDIASELKLSPKTIETYKEHLKRKLELKDKNELLKEAIVYTKVFS